MFLKFPVVSSSSSCVVVRHAIGHVNARGSTGEPSETSELPQFLGSLIVIASRPPPGPDLRRQLLERVEGGEGVARANE